MIIFDWLNQVDTQLFLALNGWNNSYFDRFFTLFTSMQVWFPLYILLVIQLVRKYKIQAIWLLLFFILTIVASDQLSGLFKVIVQRLRPTHAPALLGLVNAPAGNGGLYGFVSSHAANSFALTFLLGFLANRKRIWSAFILWSLLTVYSRIYVGVHYPLDIFCGALLGFLIAWGIYRLLLLFDHNFQQKRILKGDKWELKYTNPLLIALIFITITLFIVSFLMVKYF